MLEWVVATRSRGKLAELAPLLGVHGIRAITLAEAGVERLDEEDLIEAFPTFEENALAKARYFSRRSGLPCLADDSGLCVEALDGAPGVRSRRFAVDRGMLPTAAVDEDAANNAALIDACWDSGRAPPWRAHFACAAAYADSTRAVVALGRTDGAIVPDASGDGGFGYDPHFISADLGVAFAVASREAKARVSHRARAMQALLASLGTAIG